MVNFSVISLIILIVMQVSLFVAEGIYKEKFVDFDDRVKDFVTELEEETDHKVLWYESYGNNNVLKEERKFHRYRVHIKPSSPVFGEDSLPSIVAPRRSVVFKKWIHNGGSEVVESTISEKHTRTSTHICGITNGVTFGGSTSFSVEIPSLFSSTTEFHFDLHHESSRIQEVSESEELLVNEVVNVPANRSAKIEYMVLNEETEYPWWCNVTLDGWVAVWYQEKFRNHNLWFYPVVLLQDTNFVRRGESLVFQMHGYIRGVMETSAYLLVREYQYQDPQVPQYRMNNHAVPYLMEPQGPPLREYRIKLVSPREQDGVMYRTVREL